MRRALEQMRPVPFICAILTALAMLIGFDLVSIGRIDPAASEVMASAVAKRWVENNEARIQKSLQTSLMGTGTTVPPMGEGNFTQEKVGASGDEDYLRTVDFSLHQGEVTGRLTLKVDLRTSPATGMTARVAGASISGVKAGSLEGHDGEIFSSSPVTNARVRYYINAFCSLGWHLVIAGILFGVASMTGLKEKASVAVSLFVASATIAWASRMDPSWVVGTAALAAILVGWSTSEFIRKKRHLEVLRMITS